MQEAVLNNLKLKLSYCPNDFSSVELIYKELSNAFIHKLLNTFMQLFRFHGGVGILNIFEHLGREAWQALEVQLLPPGCKSIADLKVAVVGQTYYITRISLIKNLLFCAIKAVGDENFIIRLNLTCL